MVKKTLKGLVLSSIAFGIVGCGDTDKKEVTTPSTDTKHEKNTSVESNPLDKFTQTLPAGMSADEARKVTNDATEKLYQTYFVDGPGKEMLEKSLEIINKRISLISSHGVYNSANLNGSMTYANEQSDLIPLAGYLKQMNSYQQELFKELIVNYYLKKGYKVNEGQYNLIGFHYSISW